MDLKNGEKTKQQTLDMRCKKLSKLIQEKNLEISEYTKQNSLGADKYLIRLQKQKTEQTPLS